MLDKLKDIIHSNSQDVPDFIEVLNLSNWYLNLPKNEKEMLYQYSDSMGMGNLLEGSVKSTTETQQGYLKSVGSKAISDKNYRFAESVLLTALDAEDSNPIDRHFVYNELIKLYYKQRDERNDAIEKCIEFCQKDIESIDEFLEEYLEEYGGEPPRIPSFKRLSIIYEKQEEYHDAIEICDMALEYGLSDGTKGGFEGRKQRLQNKITS